MGLPSYTTACCILIHVTRSRSNDCGFYLKLLIGAYTHRDEKAGLIIK
jgi:hypothetical protein